MTLDELRDWQARRAGWTRDEHVGWCCEDGRSVCHPFPASLDAADASFPKGWDWGRTPPRGDWCAVSLARGITEQTTYTGDKIRDLYELSMKAWEQEAA